MNNVLKRLSGQRRTRTGKAVPAQPRREIRCDEDGCRLVIIRSPKRPKAKKPRVHDLAYRWRAGGPNGPAGPPATTQDKKKRPRDDDNQWPYGRTGGGPLPVKKLPEVPGDIEKWLSLTPEMIRIERAGMAAVREDYDIGPALYIQNGGRLYPVDGANSEAISEIRNTGALVEYAGLKPRADFARETGRRFDLYVRPDTKLDQGLKDAVTRGDVNLRYVPDDWRRHQAEDTWQPRKIDLGEALLGVDPSDTPTGGGRIGNGAGGNGGGGEW